MSFHGPMTFSRFKERRFRILMLAPELMLGLLINPERKGDDVRCFTLDGLPDNCEIDAVSYNDERHAFALRLYHPTFDVVPEAHPIPEVTVNIKAETLRVAAERRGREFI